MLQKNSIVTVSILLQTCLRFRKNVQIKGRTFHSLKPWKKILSECARLTSSDVTLNIQYWYEVRDYGLLHEAKYYSSMSEPGENICLYCMWNPIKVDVRRISLLHTGRIDLTILDKCISYIFFAWNELCFPCCWIYSCLWFTLWRSLI